MLNIVNLHLEENAMIKTAISITAMLCFLMPSLGYAEPMQEVDEVTVTSDRESNKSNRVHSKHHHKVVTPDYGVNTSAENRRYIMVPHHKHHFRVKRYIRDE